MPSPRHCTRGNHAMGRTFLFLSLSSEADFYAPNRLRHCVKVVLIRMRSVTDSEFRPSRVGLCGSRPSLCLSLLRKIGPPFDRSHAQLCSVDRSSRTVSGKPAPSRRQTWRLLGQVSSEPNFELQKLQAVIGMPSLIIKKP